MRLVLLHTGKLVGSSMGFIQEGGIVAQSGASGSCSGFPPGPDLGRAGYPGYSSPGYAFPPGPTAVPAYYSPPAVRFCRPHAVGTPRG